MGTGRCPERVGRPETVVVVGRPESLHRAGKAKQRDGTVVVVAVVVVMTMSKCGSVSGQLVVVVVVAAVLVGTAFISVTMRRSE